MIHLWWLKYSIFCPAGNFRISGDLISNWDFEIPIFWLKCQNQMCIFFGSTDFFFFFFALLLQNISFWCMQPVWKTLLQVNLQLNTFFFLISLTYILWLQLRLWFFLLSFWTSHCFHTLCYMVSLNLLISKNMYFSMRNVISWRSSPISVTLVWPTVVRPLCGSICAVETHKLSTVE